MAGAPIMVYYGLSGGSTGSSGCLGVCVVVIGLLHRAGLHAALAFCLLLPSLCGVPFLIQFSGAFSVCVPLLVSPVPFSRGKWRES